MPWKIFYNSIQNVNSRYFTVQLRQLFLDEAKIAHLDVLSNYKLQALTKLLNFFSDTQTRVSNTKNLLIQGVYAAYRDFEPKRQVIFSNSLLNMWQGNGQLEPYIELAYRLQEHAQLVIGYSLELRPFAGYLRAYAMGGPVENNVKQPHGMRAEVFNEIYRKVHALAGAEDAGTILEYTTDRMANILARTQLYLQLTGVIADGSELAEYLLQGCVDEETLTGFFRSLDMTDEVLDTAYEYAYRYWRPVQTAGTASFGDAADSMTVKLLDPITLQPVTRPARLPSCQHFTVVDYDTLVKMGYCPICGGGAGRPYLDKFLIAILMIAGNAATVTISMRTGCVCVTPQSAVTGSTSDSCYSIDEP